MIHLNRHATFQSLTLTLATVLTGSATAQTWSGAYPDMPTWSIRYAATTAFEGTQNQIFKFGGITGFSATDDVWRFHRTLGWTVLSDMPAARTDAEAVTVQVGGSDRVVLLGGGSGPTTWSTTCWWYDPATDTWDTASPAPMPTARGKVQAVTAPNGNVYVFGGQVDGTGMTTLEIYDPVLNTWSTGPAMPQLRYRFEAVSDCDGYIYIHGGYASGTVFGSVLCFDTNTGAWINDNPHDDMPFAPMPTPREDMGAALGRDGRQYLISGNSLGPVPVPVVEAYDPYSNSWSTVASLLESRNGFQAMGLGSRIWVLGGNRKIWPVTAGVEALGWLWSDSACADDVPSLPPMSLPASFQEAVLADPLTGGGLIDGVVEWQHAVYLKVRIGNLGSTVVQCEAYDEGAQLETRVRTLSGQLLVSTSGSEPVLVPDADGALGEVIVEIRNLDTAQGSAAFDLSIEGASQQLAMGEVYCTPGAPNSTGDPSAIRATGLSMAAAGSLRLEVTGLPQQSFGYFLSSRTAGIILNPGGSEGTLCLAGNIGRFAGDVLNSGDLGQVLLDVDVTSIPGNPPSAAMAGDTWHFTYWHRDFGAAGVTSNFSDAVRVVFE